MPYKPWYRSFSIVGLLVGLAGSLANYFHANVADLLPTLGAQLGDYVNTTVALAGTIGAFVARCREAHAVTLTKASALRKTAALAAAAPLPLNQAPPAPAESGARASTPLPPSDQPQPPSA